MGETHRWHQFSCKAQLKTGCNAGGGTGEVVLGILLTLASMLILSGRLVAEEFALQGERDAFEHDCIEFTLPSISPLQYLVHNDVFNSETLPASASILDVSIAGECNAQLLSTAHERCRAIDIVPKPAKPRSHLLTCCHPSISSPARMATES